MFNIKSSLIIAALFAFTLVGTSFAQGEMMHGHRGQMNQLIKKLDLTQQQKDQMSDLKFKHQKEMIDLRAQLEKNLLDLKQVKSKDNFTHDELIDAVKKVNEDRNNIALSRADFLYNIYSQLTPQQKKIWKEAQNKRDFLHNNRMRFNNRQFNTMPHKRMPFQDEKN